MSTAFKVRKSLQQSNFVTGLVLKGALAVKQTLHDWENHKLNPQLITDICRFVEDEIESSSFKGGSDIDKSQVVINIVAQLFGDLTESDKAFLDSTIAFAMDHGLVKKSSLFGKVLSTVVQLLISPK